MNVSVHSIKFWQLYDVRITPNLLIMSGFKRWHSWQLPADEMSGNIDSYITGYFASWCVSPQYTYLGSDTNPA